MDWRKANDFNKMESGSVTANMVLNWSRGTVYAAKNAPPLRQLIQGGPFVAAKNGP